MLLKIQKQKEKLWLGGFFTPEAYLTAIRQCVAQSNNWSLEELVLSVEFHDFVIGLVFSCAVSILG